jgi:hypothetical protein
LSPPSLPPTLPLLLSSPPSSGGGGAEALTTLKLPGTDGVLKLSTGGPLWGAGPGVQGGGVGNGDQSGFKQLEKCKGA